MSPLCFIETPFSEKFGAPRQSLLIQEAKGRMCFPKNDFFLEAFRGLEELTHLWLIFDFHLVSEENIQALIRPPRFQGKKKYGVFATRSPHRPNRLGLSVVKIHKFEILEKEIILEVSGVDMVNGTPIFDIKPYIPYADSITEAKALMFAQAPEPIKVHWKCESQLAQELNQLIEKVIGCDPRPANQIGEEKEFGVTVNQINARFIEKDNEFYITSVTKI